MPKLLYKLEKISKQMEKNDVDQGKEESEEWNDLGIKRTKKKLKVRKPEQLKNKFADESDYTELSSSSQEETVEGWTSVEKRKERQKRNEVRKEKRKVRMEEVALKARLTVGIGPIDERSIDFFDREVNNRDKATKLAVK